MSIECVCPECGRVLRLNPQLAGRRVRCPECSAAVSVSPGTDLQLPDWQPSAGMPRPKPRPSAETDINSKAAKGSSVSPSIPGDSRLPSGFLLGLAAGAGLIAVFAVAVSLTRTMWWPDATSQESANGTSIRSRGAADLSPAVSPDAAAAQPAEIPAAIPDVASLLTAREDVSGTFSLSPADRAVAALDAAPVPEAEPETAAPEPKLDSAIPVEAEEKPAPAAVAPPQPVLLATSPESVAEADAVAAVLKTACYRCHGESGTNEGGMNYVASLSRIRESLVRPGDPKNSLLMQRIEAADQATQMPPPGEEPRLTPEQMTLVRNWIQNGAAVPQAQEERSFITEETLVKTIHEDLMAQNERSRRFVRYFTLTHLYNAGVSAEELQTHRLAFAKLINSLSWGRELVLPHQVDKQGTVLRLDIRDLTWSVETWDEISGVNPYPFEPDVPEALVCTEQCGTHQPWIRADWFVFKASQPPLYHHVLRIPETERELEQMLHVDALTNIDQEQVLRAGFNRSGVSRNNRLIERHKIGYGAYWKSYDFAGNTGRQNLFEFPQGPAGQEAFKHDGGELIFSLPNGLHAYMLVDGLGARLDSGPAAIVSDPATHDRTVINGVSCFSCHFAGIIRKTDEIRPFLDVNAASFENVEFLKSIYPGQEQLNQHYAADAAAWLRAVNQLGIVNTSRAGEPISSMSQHFQAEVSTSMAAAEFGLTERQFLDRMSRLPALPRSLGALRVPGGTMKRDSFTEVFREAVSMLRIDPDSQTATQRIAAAQVIVPRIQLNQVTVLGQAFQPSGGRVVVSTRSGTLVLADTRTGNIIAASEPLQGRTFGTAICMSVDGRRILAATAEGRVCVFDVTSDGKLAHKWDYDGHAVASGNTQIRHLLFSRDGTAALTICSNRKLHIWSPGTRRLLRELTDPMRGDIIGAWLASDGRDFRVTTGRELVSGSSRSTRPLKTMTITDSYPGHAAFSPNGKLLITDVVRNRSLGLFDAETGKSLATINSARNLPFSSMLLCSSGNLLLLSGFGQTQIWDLANQTLLSIADPLSISRQNTLFTAVDNDILAWSEPEGSSGSAITMTRLTAQTTGDAVGSSRGAGSLAAGSRRSWKSGDKAEIRYGGSWAPVTILQTNPNKTVRIHWDGWSDNWDQDVQPAELRPVIGQSR